MQVKLLYLCGWTHKAAHVFKNANAIPNILISKSDTNPLNNYIAKKRIYFRISKKCYMNFKNLIGFFSLLLSMWQINVTIKSLLEKYMLTKFLIGLLNYFFLDVPSDLLKTIHNSVFQKSTIQLHSRQLWCTWVVSLPLPFLITAHVSGTQMSPASHILLKTVQGNSFPSTRAADTTYFFADLIAAVYFSTYWLYFCLQTS